MTKPNQSEPNQSEGSNSSSPEEFREALGALIADLARGDPKDPNPAITRDTVRLLRVLHTCGPEEMIEAINNANMAGIAAITAASGDEYEAAKVMLRITTQNALTWINTESNATKPPEAKPL